MAEHLWEASHPYYAQEGNYYARDMHERYDSWAEFMEEMGTADEDLNLVYRWDWKQNMDDDENPVGAPGDGTLFLFYMGQRKAKCWSCEVAVPATDEPDVRAWLERKWEHMRRLWVPFSGLRTPAESSSP